MLQLKKLKNAKKRLGSNAVLGFLSSVFVLLAQAEKPPDTKLFNPLKYDNPEQVIGIIIKGILGITGVAALCLFIWGGFLIFFSRGNKELVSKGKSTLVWAVIGLAIIFSSYSLLTFVFKVLNP